MSSDTAVIAYDGSDGAQAAIERAAELLGPRPAIVLTAWSPILMGAPAGYLIPTHADELDEELEQRARETAQAGAQLARKAGFDASTRTARASSVWSAIVETADELDALVVIVGARGLSAVKSALLGSTSNGVLDHTARPVLVVPNPNPK